MGGSKEKTGRYGSYYPGNKLPSRQIVHSTQQIVYLAHANMHANHLLVAIFWLPLLQISAIKTML